MKTYTTTRGKKWIHPLTKKQWTGIRRKALRGFDGSAELFNSCWVKYRREILPGTDDPESILDVSRWMEAIASEKVNDPQSEFYIYG